MAQGTTFDFYVSQLAISYEGYVHDKEKRRANGEVINPPAKLTQEQMMDMIARVKAKENVSKDGSGQ